MGFDFHFVFSKFPQILTGLPVTLLITFVAMAVGTVLGFFIALARIHKTPVLSQFCRLYVSFTRGTPLVVQLYLVFYTIPVLLHHDVSPLTAALFCYSLNTAAYLSDLIRAALGSVELAQLEAAYSIGESYPQALGRIILPQAFLIAYPSLTNSLLNLLKGTSLAFTVMVIDLMARAKIVAAEGYRYLEAFLVAAVIYWLVCFAIEKLCKLYYNRTFQQP
jgi:L-cystine transport system permease protein